MSNANGCRRDATRPAKCRLCGAELRSWERPEGYCDDCLRARQMRPPPRKAAT
jgi:hypothetical protein